MSSNLKNPGPSTRRRKNRKEIEQEPVAEEDLVAEAGLNYDEIDFIEQVSARPNPRRQSQRLLEVRRREEVGTDENHERVARAFQMLTDNTSKSSRIPVLHETYTTYYNQLLDKVTETANNKATPASYPVKNSTHDSVLKFYDPHGKGIWWKHMCLVVNPSNINERFVKSSNLGLCKICNCFIPWKSLNQKLGLKHFAICHKEVYDTFFRKEEDTLGEMKVSEVHNLWIDFFMFHNLPLSLCNSPVLKFILNNYYRVPRSYKPLNSKSAQKLVNQIAAAERAKLKAEFDDTVLFYSLTADGWSSRNEVHYLGITVHFLDEHFGYHSHKLDLCEMAGRQGAVHYYTALDTTLQNYGLKKENLAVFARDGASVMANVSNELRMVISDTAYFLEAAEDIHCVAHRLNLIMGLLMFRKKEDLNSDIRVGVALSEHSRDLLGEGFVHDEACWRNIKMNSRLKEVEKNELKNLFPERIKEVISLLSRAKAAVGKARRFSTLYHNSSIVRLKLKEVRQKRISEKATKEDVNKGPVIDVVTRWNSSYVMVERLVELKDDVDSLFQKAAD
ncbi:hypothetical protein GWO13_05100, partial [Candidatus Bathyarchaeota archaeon]|nr:hypothetical protein [Candidatus Bathyarchaeota archaeon]